MSTIAAILPPMARKSLPESEKKVPLNSRVPPWLFKAVQALADADDRTVSYMVEKGMREYVERHGKKQTEPKRR